MLWQTYSLELLKLCVELLKAAAWPFVLGMGLWHFRADIGALLQETVKLIPRLKSFKAGGLELTADEAAKAKEVKSEELQKAAEQLAHTHSAAEKAVLVQQIGHMGAEIQRLTQLQREAEMAEEARQQAKRRREYHEALNERLAKEAAAAARVPPDALSPIAAMQKEAAERAEREQKA